MCVKQHAAVAVIATSTVSAHAIPTKIVVNCHHTVGISLNLQQEKASEINEDIQSKMNALVTSTFIYEVYTYLTPATIVAGIQNCTYVTSVSSLSCRCEQLSSRRRALRTRSSKALIVSRGNNAISENINYDVVCARSVV